MRMKHILPNCSYLEHKTSALTFIVLPAEIRKTYLLEDIYPMLRHLPALGVRAEAPFSSLAVEEPEILVWIACIILGSLKSSDVIIPPSRN